MSYLLNALAGHIQSIGEVRRSRQESFQSGSNDSHEIEMFLDEEAAESDALDEYEVCHPSASCDPLISAQSLLHMLDSNSNLLTAINSARELVIYSEEEES